MKCQGPDWTLSTTQPAMRKVKNEQTSPKEIEIPSRKCEDQKLMPESVTYQNVPEVMANEYMS